MALKNNTIIQKLDFFSLIAFILVYNYVIHVVCLFWKGSIENRQKKTKKFSNDDLY